MVLTLGGETHIVGASGTPFSTRMSLRWSGPANISFDMLEGKVVITYLFGMVVCLSTEL